MKEKINILVVVTDQLTWRALPYYGNTYVKTPNIDRICEGAVGFEEAYCSLPMCQPSRASIWSGLYPHETNVLSNGRMWDVEDLSKEVPTLGTLFKAAGYRTIHFGKTHDAGALNGFECVEKGQVKFETDNSAWPLNQDSFADRDTTLKASEFLENYQAKNPYLMIVDYVNPHNICGWVGAFAHQTPGGDPGMALPDLPENFQFPDIENRPLPVQYICCSHNRQAQAAGWEDKKFQYYLAAYYHYLELVDQEIGVLLDALETREDKENTLILFMSDHGDSMAARGRVTKQVDFYEEVARVPFIFKGPKILPRKETIKGFPVSLMDVVPTLCSYAGISYPQTLFGKDLMPALTGGSLPDRDYIACQWHTEWGFTVSPGRMIRDERYKYIYYLEGQGEELYDLHEDPLEKVNLVKNEIYHVILEKMRNKFKKYLEETADPFESLQWDAAEKWRTHELGYQKHQGLAAPAFYDATHGKLK